MLNSSEKGIRPCQKNDIRFNHPVPNVDVRDLRFCRLKKSRPSTGMFPNIDLECGECMLKYTTDVKTACPEWDQDCKLQQS